MGFDLVLFDVDDTLYDMTQPFMGAYATCFGDRFDVDPLDVYRASRRHSDEVYEASRTGAMSMPEMYAYRMTRAFADYGIGVSDAEALAFQDVYASEQGRIRMSPVIEGLLGWLCGRVGLGIVTNGPDAHQREKCVALGCDRWIPDDAVFTSGGLGVAKPDPRIFGIVCERMGVAAERTLYVGDTFGSDVAGACAAGIPVVWYDRRGNAVPADADCSPTWTVTGDEALTDLVREVVARP